MGRRMASGLLLAVVAFVIIALSGPLGLDLEHVALLGAALGAVLGLVSHQPDWGKFAGFGLGFVMAWIGFALRAAALPDAAVGRAIAAFVVVAVLAVVAGATSERIPLWSGLIGAAALVGAYEGTYTDAPSEFLSTSPGAATTVLLAVALGFLATVVLAPVGASPAGTPAAAATPVATTADDEESDPEQFAEEEIQGVDVLTRGESL